jgi:hypothetical protein
LSVINQDACSSDNRKSAKPLQQAYTGGSTALGVSKVTTTVRVCAGSMATSRIRAKCTTPEVLDHRDLVKRTACRASARGTPLSQGTLPDDLWLWRLKADSLADEVGHAMTRQHAKT